jgi:hypothetical protein
MRLGVFVYDQMVIFTVIFNGAKSFASMVTNCHLSTLIDTMNFFNVASFLFCFFFIYLFFGPILIIMNPFTRKTIARKGNLAP